MTHTHLTLPPLPNYPPTPDIITVPEAAELLHCTAQQVGYFIKREGLKAAKVGKRWLIDRSDVFDFIRQKLHTPGAGANA